MEAARLGCEYLQVLCFKILQAFQDSGQEPMWNRGSTSVHFHRNQLQSTSHRNPGSDQMEQEHFIDADPTHFPFWLGYFRTQKVPRVEAGPLWQRLLDESEEAGLKDLAELRRLVDWRRAAPQTCGEQRLLVH